MGVLEPGELTLIVEFAKGLKDKDWFGKQDPYCLLTCGAQTFRGRTAKDGGTSPVWNETFNFSVINENDIGIVIKDEDTGKDDTIGTAHVPLAKAREHGRDSQQVPVLSKSGKQHGFIQLTLTFAKNSSIKGYAGSAGVPPAYPTAMMGYPPPSYQPPPFASGHAPSPGYPPPTGPPPQQYSASYPPPGMHPTAPSAGNATPGAPPSSYPPAVPPPAGAPPTGYPPAGAPPFGYPPSGASLPGYPPPGAPSGSSSHGWSPGYPPPQGAPYGAPPPVYAAPPGYPMAHCAPAGYPQPVHVSGQAHYGAPGHKQKKHKGYKYKGYKHKKYKGHKKHKHKGFKLW